MEDDANSILGGLLEQGGNFVSYITNFASEIAIIEGIFLQVLVPFVGFMISATAVLDVIRMKDPRYAQKVAPASVAARAMVGPITILLQSFMLQVAESVLGEDKTNGKVPNSMTYSAAISGQSDPMAVMLLGITAFLVFVGWVTAFRSMLAFARCGDPQQDGYQLAKSGLARLGAATALTMFQFFMDDLFESATGSANSYSSELNL